MVVPRKCLSDIRLCLRRLRLFFQHPRSYYSPMNSFLFYSLLFRLTTTNLKMRRTTALEARQPKGTRQAEAAKPAVAERPTDPLPAVRHPASRRTRRVTAEITSVETTNIAATPRRKKTVSIFAMSRNYQFFNDGFPDRRSRIGLNYHARPERLYRKVN